MSSPRRRGQVGHGKISQVEKRSILENYDLETKIRVNQLKNAIRLRLDWAHTKMMGKIDRIPRAARQLTVEEFIQEYHASVEEFLRSSGKSDGLGEEDRKGEEAPRSTKRARRHADEEDLRKGKRKKPTAAKAAASSNATALAWEEERTEDLQNADMVEAAIRTKEESIRILEAQISKLRGRL